MRVTGGKFSGMWITSSALDSSIAPATVDWLVWVERNQTWYCPSYMCRISTTSCREKERKKESIHVHVWDMYIQAWIHVHIIYCKIHCSSFITCNVFVSLSPSLPLSLSLSLSFSLSLSLFTSQNLQACFLINWGAVQFKWVGSSRSIWILEGEYYYALVCAYCIHVVLLLSYMI